MPTLGLAMIVKNGAHTLRECLASVAGLTNQIVIADTGSTDGSAQLARDLGAKVFDLPWQDDFAQARNAALQALTTDWALVLDDDEELDPEARAKIPSLLDNAAVGGYCLTLRNYLPVRFSLGGHAPSVQPNNSSIERAKRSRAHTDFSICRLFRRHPEIYYVGRVHELVESRIRAVGLEIRMTGLVIHHFGILVSDAERRAKDEVYRRLGRLKVQENPNDADAWVELGLQEYEQFKNYSAGIECLEKALALNPMVSPVPYLSLANLYIEIHDYARALQVLNKTTMSGRSAGEHAHISGDALYNLGWLQEARAAYLRALEILPEDARVRSKLGLTEVRLGLKKKGLIRLANALEAAPEVFEMHDRLIKAYLVMNRLPQAADAAERMATELPNPTTILRAVSIRSHMKQWRAAEKIVDRGLELLPEDQQLLEAKRELQREMAVPAKGNRLLHHRPFGG